MLRVAIYYVNLGFRRRMIALAPKSCNWKGFIDIKTSHWKIGLYTGLGGPMEILIFFKFDKYLR